MSDMGPISRQGLLEYFLGAAKPRDRWQVGMEVERLARDPNGAPVPYDGPGPSIRAILEAYHARRPESLPILEGANLVGLDAAFGNITLEPGGQVEWSSKPRRSLADLERDLVQHLGICDAIAAEVGIAWLPQAVDPQNPVDAMPWMPKARYKIMRPFLGERGRLAHRMMTQSASIHIALDYSDPEDWRRKFLAAARLSPIAVALFANSHRVDGRESGYRSFRQAIWRETDPARCGLPPVVFDPGFDIEVWLDWTLEVPTIFRHRARGLVPAGGVPFRELIALTGCEAIHAEDWETHVSTIFTEVRSYTYIEIRSADLQPTDLMFAVPAFWTGLLYDEGSLSAALELGERFSTRDGWTDGMAAAAREGVGGQGPWRDLAAQAVGLAQKGLAGAAGLGGETGPAVAALERLAAATNL